MAVVVGACCFLPSSALGFSCGGSFTGTWHGHDRVPRDAHIWARRCSWPELGIELPLKPSLAASAPETREARRMQLALTTARGGFVAGTVSALDERRELLEVIPSGPLQPDTAYELIAFATGYGEEVLKRATVSQFRTGFETSSPTIQWHGPSDYRTESHRQGRYEWKQEWLTVALVDQRVPLVRVEAADALRRNERNRFPESFFIDATGQITAGVACSCARGWSDDDDRDDDSWSVLMRPVSASGSNGPAYIVSWNGERLGVESPVRRPLLGLVTFLGGIAALWALARTVQRAPH